MTIQILNFKKKEHFMLRQWERGIDDRTIRLALKYVIPNKSQLIVLGKMFFEKHGLSWSAKFLIIKIIENKLVTIFKRKQSILNEYITNQKNKQLIKIIA